MFLSIPTAAAVWKPAWKRKCRETFRRKLGIKTVLYVGLENWQSYGCRERHQTPKSRFKIQLHRINYFYYDTIISFEYEYYPFRVGY